VGRATKRRFMITASYAVLIIGSMVTTYFCLKTITVSLAIGTGALIIYLLAAARGKKRIEKRVTDSGIYDIDRMNNSQFELFLLHLFKGLGYEVEVRRSGSTGGTELFICKDDEQAIVIAANDRRHMGVDAVKQAVEAKACNNAASAWLVTNRDFSSAAYSLANKKEIRLVNRESLIDMVIIIKSNQKVEPAHKTMSDRSKQNRANL